MTVKGNEVHHSCLSGFLACMNLTQDIQMAQERHFALVMLNSNDGGRFNPRHFSLSSDYQILSFQSGKIFE
jgi:hypothetical protein